LDAQTRTGVLLLPMQHNVRATGYWHANHQTCTRFSLRSFNHITSPGRQWCIQWASRGRGTIPYFITQNHPAAYPAMQSANAHYIHPVTAGQHEYKGLSTIPAVRVTRPHGGRPYPGYNVHPHSGESRELPERRQVGGEGVEHGEVRNATSLAVAVVTSAQGGTGLVCAPGWSTMITHKHHIARSGRRLGMRMMAGLPQKRSRDWFPTPPSNKVTHRGVPLLTPPEPGAFSSTEIALLQV